MTGASRILVGVLAALVFVGLAVWTAKDELGGERPVLPEGDAQAEAERGDPRRPGVPDSLRGTEVDGALVVNRTRDGGKTFETLRQGLPQSHCYDLIYRHALVVDTAGTRLAMGSTTGNLWVSDSAGEGWEQIAGHLPPIAQVAFA